MDRRPWPESSHSFASKREGASAQCVWLLTYIQRLRWLVRTIAYVTGTVLILEMGLITLQVVRGVASHFNVSTFFDGAVFSTMGAVITLLT